MHPLEATLDSSFHNPKQQMKRRSSLDNSALSAEESFMSLIPDIKEYGSSSRRRRYSLNSCENKTTTFLAELLPKRCKKDLDMDFHASGHSDGPVRRCGGRGGTRESNNKLENGTGDTQNTSLGDTMDLSESSMESSSNTFCDAEEGEPANRAYLQKDLGASCFWDDDFESGSDEENGKPVVKALPRSSERNQRIQAALERVRKSKEKGNSTPLEEDK